jgi:hypothetical protein
MSLNVVVENGSRMVKPMKERYGLFGSKQKFEVPKQNCKTM